MSPPESWHNGEKEVCDCSFKEKPQWRNIFQPRQPSSSTSSLFPLVTRVFWNETTQEEIRSIQAAQSYT